MRRPTRVGEAIRQLDNGLQVGRHGAMTLFSAYQPIYRYAANTSLELVGLEGLVRPYVNEISITPSLLFQHTDPEDDLFIECMCQALHIRNYALASSGECDLYVNINTGIYTSVEMAEREFHFMLSQLRKNGLSPRRLVLEVLETAPGHDAMLLWLREFAREFEIRFAMDDFGRGQSNLRRYLQLKPDVVKIDAQLFNESLRCATRSKQVLDIIAHVHGDGGQIVIEGIETAAKLAAALELGADLLQGYYLNTPDMQIDEFYGHCFPLQNRHLH